MESHITTIIAIILLVAMSAYFGATETAFTSFNRVRMKNMAAEGNKKAGRVLKVAENYDRFISTVLIGNNIVNITTASIAALMFVDIFGSSVGAPLSTVIITLIILIFGEVTPKSLIKEMPEKFCLFSAPIISFFSWLFTPLNYFFALWKRFVVRAFTIDPGNVITEEELLTIVEEAETEGGIEKEQRELIQNAIEFNDLEAWDVLTPRVDVTAIDIETPKEAVMEIFRETGFSRLPVYEETIDKVIGILNQKDFSNFIVNSDKEISEYVKPVVFVAGSAKIAVILKKMQAIKTHMAVIIDEYGGTEGIVTMEDIIEELVGEIYDEHDEVATQEFLQRQDGSYRILCGANVEKMFDYLEVEGEEMDVTTVNGWVVVELGRLPVPGDSFIYKNLSVTVTKADEKKALEIKIVKLENSDEEREGQQ